MTLIKLDKSALKDLEYIFKRINEDKPSIANEYIEKIRSYIKLLETNPEMGKDCKESGFNRDCRVLFYGNYTILYKINKTQISIKRVINTKQNYKGK